MYLSQTGLHCNWQMSFDSRHWNIYSLGTSMFWSENLSKDYCNPVETVWENSGLGTRPQGCRIYRIAPHHFKTAITSKQKRAASGLHWKPGKVSWLSKNRRRENTNNIELSGNTSPWRADSGRSVEVAAVNDPGVALFAHPTPTLVTTHSTDGLDNYLNCLLRLAQSHRASNILWILPQLRTTLFKMAKRTWRLFREVRRHFTSPHINGLVHHHQKIAFQKWQQNSQVPQNSQVSHTAAGARRVLEVNRHSKCSWETRV